MGLDMYLQTVKTEHSYPDGTPEAPYQGRHITHITKEDVGYFRKFNALHGYISATATPYGIENCQDVYLSAEYIEETLEMLKDLKAHPEKVAEVLPPTDGFFFGSQEVDEYYWQNVDDAIETFQRILDTVDFTKVDVIYYAWW